MQIRPGSLKKQSSFINRCAKLIDDCVVDELADGAIICGECVPSAIVEDTTEKQLFAEGPGQEGRKLEAFWLKREQPNARSGDPFVYDGKTYTIKDGFPIDLRDCWLTAELSTCGTC